MFFFLLRFVIGGAFFIAGALKLMDVETFAKVVGAFGLLPEFLVPYVALLLPITEVAAGAGLIFNIRGSLPTLGFLTVIFMAVLGYGMHLGLDIDCGCYGPSDPEGEAFASMRTSFIRDCFLLAGIIALAFRKRKLESELQPRP